MQIYGQVPESERSVRWMLEWQKGYFENPKWPTGSSENLRMAAGVWHIRGNWVFPCCLWTGGRLRLFRKCALLDSGSFEWVSYLGCPFSPWSLSPSPVSLSWFCCMDFSVVFVRTYVGENVVCVGVAVLVLLLQPSVAVDDGKISKFFFFFFF